MSLPGGVDGRLRRAYYLADMCRMLSISVAVGSFVILPALCVGGLITHACDFADMPGCNSEPGCEHESDCHHESTCSDDPCDNMVTRSNRPGVDGNPTSQSPTPCVTSDTIPAQGACLTFQCKDLTTTYLKNLPFPHSDIPLLI